MGGINDRLGMQPSDVSKYEKTSSYKIDIYEHGEELLRI
jgi:hypothetical protein